MRLPFSPMLAVKANPHSRPDWLYELKLDGQRCIASTGPDAMRLQARSLRDITILYPEIRLQTTCSSVILDGELVCLNEHGMPDFQVIQRRLHQSLNAMITVLSQQSPAQFHVFDILWADNRDLVNLPLLERKAILKQVLVETDSVRLLPWTVGNGIELFNQACAAGYEGVMAKKANSPYLEGRRSATWQKMKPMRSGTFLAVGLTKSDKRSFGSIILAEERQGQLAYVGRVASGLAPKDMDAWLTRPDVTGPLIVMPSQHTVIKWFKPEEIKVHYYERTPDGHLRFPHLVPQSA